MIDVNRPITEKLLDDSRQSSTNRKIIGRLTSRYNSFGSSEAESAKMADYRFETLNEVEVEW